MHVELSYSPPWKGGVGGGITLAPSLISAGNGWTKATDELHALTCCIHMGGSETNPSPNPSLPGRGIGTTLSLLGRGPGTAPITALALGPQEKELVVGSQKGVEVFSWPEMKPLRRLPTELLNIHDIAFSTDHKHIAIVGGKPGESGSVEILDWTTGKQVQRITPHQDVVYSIAWNDSGDLVATASADGIAKLLEVSSGKTITLLQGHSRPVTCVTWLPNQKRLVTGSVDESIRLWNSAGESLRTLSNHTRPVLGLAVRPGHYDPPQLVSIGADKTVRLWQPTIGRMTRFARLTSEPRAVGWTQDGALFVAACVDGKARIIDPETVEVKRELIVLNDVAHCLAISKDGHIIVGGANGQLKSVKIP